MLYSKVIFYSYNVTKKDYNFTYKFLPIAK
jgi:hypothetical protein